MAVALGFRRRLQTGPALRITPIPLASLTLSVILHAALIVASVIAVNAIKETQPKVYVINLVPAVPAIGRPEGQSPTPDSPPAPRPEPPPQVAPTPEPPVPPAPAAPPTPVPPPRPAAPELPSRTATAPSRDLPPRNLPPRPREASGLPDRTLPPRSAAPAAPRPEQKELPSVASAAAPQPPASAPASTARPAQATPAREAPSAPATAGLPTGSPVGKGKLSITVDFPYAWYVKIIRDKIAEQWDPYAMPGQQPRVAFEIGRNGDVNVARIRVVQSSGSAQYDRIAVRAIAQAGKFPPLPDDFKDQVVTIDIQFRFDAERS